MIPEFISNPSHEYYLSENYLVLDFETTNLEKGSALHKDNRLLLAVWWFEGELKSKWGSEYEVEELLTDIDNADFIVAHNAKFELQWLARCGYELETVLPYDTMIGEYVLWSNHRKRGNLKLGTLSKKYGFGHKDVYVDVCMQDGICPSELPRTLLEKRCRKDVLQTRGIFLRQRERLLESGKLPVQFTRCILTPVLADMESKGLALDPERVTKIYFEYKKELDSLTAQLNELTGGINPKSTPQVAKFLYETLEFSEPRDSRGNILRGKPTKQFPDGLPKTDATTIAGLKARTKIQKEFLRLKQAHSKLFTLFHTYIEFFYATVVEQNGLLYGTFNQTITATQRLSSSGRKQKFNLFDKAKGPQLQNLPRVFKKLFTVKNKDYVYCEPDGSQLEFRVAGHLGRDVQIIQDIIDQVDVHTFTANTQYIHLLLIRLLLQDKKLLDKMLNQEPSNHCMEEDQEQKQRKNITEHSEKSIQE